MHVARSFSSLRVRRLRLSGSTRYVAPRMSGRVSPRSRRRGLKTVYEAVLDIIKREGILGLYSGLNSSLLGIAVTNG